MSCQEGGHLVPALLVQQMVLRGRKTKRGKVGKWEKEVGQRDPQGVSDQRGCQETEGGLKSNNKEDGYLQRGRLLAKRKATYKEYGYLQRGWLLAKKTATYKEDGYLQRRRLLTKKTAACKEDGPVHYLLQRIRIILMGRQFA